ncbi:MAG: hypothetical protein WCA78_15770 [Rhizomicrobium sp.]
MTKPTIQNREDEVLLRMLKTPPKPHAEMKHPRVKKPKPSRVSRTKRAASTNASKVDGVS